MLTKIAPFPPLLKRLRAPLRRPSLPPPEPPDDPCPLAHPHAPLPAWVEADPVVQHYRALLGDLPWTAFPERSTDRPGPLRSPTRAPPSSPPISSSCTRASAS
ncbi:MAG: hypothetical protein ACJ8CR_27355, partial [Roseiflexaceae bacterium]